MKINLRVVIIYILSHLITSWVVYVLWNWLFPNLFNFPHIGYIESIGIYTLTNILFKNSDIKVKEQETIIEEE
jgi:hypothetical protein